MIKYKIVYQFECTKDCDKDTHLPNSWNNEVDLTLSDFQSIIEQIADGFICPTCGAIGKLVSIVLIKDGDEQMIDLIYGGIL